MKNCRGGQNRALCISWTFWHTMRPVHVLSYIYIYITLIRSHGWVRTSIICIRPYFHLPYNFSFHKDVQIFTPQWGHCSDFSHFWGNVSWFFCLQYFENLYMVHWYIDRHLQNNPIWLFFVTCVPPYPVWWRRSERVTIVFKRKAVKEKFAVSWPNEDKGSLWNLHK